MALRWGSSAAKKSAEVMYIPSSSSRQLEHGSDYAAVRQTMYRLRLLELGMYRHISSSSTCMPRTMCAGTFAQGMAS